MLEEKLKRELAKFTFGITLDFGVFETGNTNSTTLLVSVVFDGLDFKPVGVGADVAGSDVSSVGVGFFSLMGDFFLTTEDSAEGISADSSSVSGSLKRLG